MLGAGSGGAEEAFRCGHREIAPVVLPYTEGMKAYLVSELGLLEELAQHLGVRNRLAVRKGADVPEGVQAQQYASGANRRPGVCRGRGSGNAVPLIGTPSASRRARQPSR